MSKEAMTLALEALKYVYEGANNQGPFTGISWRCVSNKAEPVIKALEEALAKQEQGEPVAWVNVTEGGKWYVQYTLPKELMPEGTKFYTTPQPTQKPLTIEQIAKLDCYDHLKFARAIEAAHGIKENT